MRELNYYFIGNKPLVKSEMKTATIEECYNYLKDKSVVSLDIETTYKFGGRYEGEGLNPYLSQIVMIQLGDEHKQFIIDNRVMDVTSLLTLLTDPSITIVGQNLKFEYVHFLHNFGVRLTGVYDTMIAENILYNGLNVEASLKALNKRYLGITVDKSTALEFLRIKDRPFSTRQIKYGAEDILYPLLIRKKQLEDINEKDLERCLSLEMLFLPVLGDIEYKGMCFNKAKWLDTYDKNLVKYKELKKELNDYVVGHFTDTDFVNKQLSLFDDEFTCRISWTSSKQVIEFFKYLGICPMTKSKETNKMAYTVNAKVVRASLNTSNKHIEDKLKYLLDLYLEFKEISQACTTFGEAFFKHINPVSGRLHSNYRQILNTGRISSSGPNLQNIPADHGFRYAFDAPEGWKIVNADYSGQETVILADRSGEENMIELITSGNDMHCFVVRALDPSLASLTDKEIKIDHADERQTAKAAGFAIQFGGNGHTISSNLGITLEEGDFAYDSYFRAFPNLKKYFDRVFKETLKNGYVLVDPITCRKRFFPYPKTGAERHTIMKMSLNTPIQGTAGSVTKLAPILFRKWILDNGYENEIFITNIVHDEINLEVKEHLAQLAARGLEKCMGKAGDKWCKIVPLTAKAAVTDFWNH